MSIEYKAVLCYGVQLTHEKELAYIERVGEDRWEQILDKWFIGADNYSGRSLDGILGMEAFSAEDGEIVNLGAGRDIVNNIPYYLMQEFREVMFELEEFECRPQLHLICQVS